MKLLCLLLFSTLLFFSEAHSQAPAWSYRGIPYVTSPVPDVLMPNLPTGANGKSFPYDPCTLATPVFANGARQFYVNSESGDDKKAGNNGRGSVAQPRKTLPGRDGKTWRISAGWQIFMTANSTFIGEGNDVNVFPQGTSQNVCWLIGVGGRPKFSGDKFYIFGQHLILDNLLFTSVTKPSRIRFGNDGVGAQFITLRNSVIDGQGTAANAAVAGSGGKENRSSYICIYNNEIKNMGNWNRQDDQGVDKHGIQMTSWTDHWWIIKNKIFHCEGDSVQVSTSNFYNAISAYRPHYIYIAGNHFFENYENAVDTKNSFHCIISENLIHDFYNKFKVSNATAMILANDGEGWLSGYEWALYNTIYNCRTGIKMAPTAALTVDDPEAIIPVQTQGQKVYAIGNVIYNTTHEGINLDGRGTDPNGSMERTWFQEMWVVNNSIRAGMQPIHQLRTNQNPSQPGMTTIVGNVLWNDGVEDEIDLVGGNGQTDNVLYNLCYRKGMNVSLNTKKFDLYQGNILNQNPEWVDAGNSNFRLKSGSPAIDKMVNLPSPYALFEKMYGISIAPKMTGSSYDLGAYEKPASGDGPPSAPTTLRVVSVE